MRTGSLRRRIVAATALVSTLGVVVLVTLVVVLTARASDAEVRTTLSTRIAAVRSTVTVDDGRLDIPDGNDALYDTLTWVYDTAGRERQGPTVPAPLVSAVAGLSRAEQPTNLTSGRWAVAAAPIRWHGERVATAVVATDTRPFASSLQRAAVASGLLGVGVIVGVTVLAAAIVRRALAPVAVLAATADEWSQDRLERRFDLGRPTDEITALGAVLDRLLERVGTAIRAEQRLTAELAHELRTPLTVIRAEADLGRMQARSPAVRERFDRIAAASTDMAAAMTTLLNAARGQMGSDARAPVVPAIAAALDRFVRPGIAVREDLVAADVAVPAELLDRVLAPLLDNAFRFAGSTVDVAVAPRAAAVVIEIGNDGPPVALEEQALFTPGTRDDESPGAGLGLSLSRRLAQAAGGEVALVSADPARFAVTLPRAT